ncbi:MAG: 50S ribosomal protein L4 [Jatrophihabitans sp.]
MTSVTIHNPADDTESTNAVELPAALFDAKTNVSLIHQVVVAQLGAARQGTASTKTRAEVRGGGRKPYRQKGTGRARQGSTRAPQFAGGGVVHGPTPRSYEQRTPKKMKAAALRGALSDRARAGRVHVVASLVTGETPSTKAAATSLAEITSAKNVLVVVGNDDEQTWLSLRNLTSVHLLDAGQLNTYDVLVSDDVVFTEAALREFVAARADGAELVITEVEAKKKPAKKAAAKKSAKADAADDAEDEDAKPAKAAKKAAEKKIVETSDSDADADDADDEVADDDAPDYGPDAHLPIDDDAQPEGFPIKGNASSKLYHVPDSAFYDRTIAEVWFKTAEAAEAAGFELPPSQREDDASEEDDA